MSVRYTIKSWLKIGRWQARRAITTLRWDAETRSRVPAVLGNAMPKSGSHLIIQVLQGLVEIGPFVNPGFPPVNRTEDNRKLPDSEILANILRMQPGDIGYGYVQAREPFITALTDPSRATIFVFRDPRDVIVSHVFYATEMHTGHGMHTHYNKNLDNTAARINAAIQGVDKPGSELSDILSKYKAYLGWLDIPNILNLRFEDLILDREVALGKILDYLSKHGFIPQADRSTAIETMKRSIQPKKSGTFRKGKPGNWREHFTQENIQVFKAQTGDLLQRLGYEEDLDWS